MENGRPFSLSNPLLIATHCTGIAHLSTMSKLTGNMTPQLPPHPQRTYTNTKMNSMLRLGLATSKRSAFPCNSTSSIICRSMSDKASSTTSSVSVLDLLRRRLAYVRRLCTPQNTLAVAALSSLHLANH